MALVALALLFASGKNAGAAPERADYHDVGRLISHGKYKSAPWQYALDGHALTQTEKAARVEFLIGRAIPELIGFLDEANPSQVQQAVGQLSLALELDVGYRDREDLASGWEYQNDDRFYGKAFKVLEMGYDAVMRGDNCRAVTMTPGLRRLLNVRLVGNRCVDGAVDERGALLTQATGIKCDACAKIGGIKTSPQTALTKTQNAAKDTLHHVHLAGSLDSSPGNASVLQAHYNFEATAKNETQRHSFMAPAFHGMIGAGIPLDRMHTYKKMTEIYHAAAIGCYDVKGKVDGGCADIRWQDHTSAHECLNMPDRATLKVMFAQQRPDGSFSPPGTWPVHTCQEWAAIFATRDTAPLAGEAK